MFRSSAQLLRAPYLLNKIRLCTPQALWPVKQNSSSASSVYLAGQRSQALVGEARISLAHVPRNLRTPPLVPPRPSSSESSPCRIRSCNTHPEIPRTSRASRCYIRIADTHSYPPIRIRTLHRYHDAPHASAAMASDTMNFSIPPALQQYLTGLDAFIEAKIVPLQKIDDNDRFFDHRREHARTDWDNGGLPRPEWEALLGQCRRLADEAGFYRHSLPKQYGGRSAEDGRGSNLWMAVIREHLAAKGLGLFNDLQNEHSVVGNFPDVVMVINYGNSQQREELIGGRLKGKVRITFGLTEPGHGSDATHMDTRGRPEKRNGVDGWVLDGRKKWQTGMHAATHCFIFARTQGENGQAKGISCFVVPRETPGLEVESYEWYATASPLLQLSWFLAGGLIISPQDTQHAHRPRHRLHQKRLGPLDLGARSHPQRPGRRASFRPRKPHPPSRLLPRRRPLLHPRIRLLRQRPRPLRHAPLPQPSHPIPPRRARHPGRDAAPIDPQGRRGDGQHAACRGGKAHRG
ncbi:hypothetical protein PMIN02_009579 [Paraphaeosphaeria minitans]